MQVNSIQTLLFVVVCVALIAAFSGELPAVEFHTDPLCCSHTFRESANSLSNVHRHLVMPGVLIMSAGQFQMYTDT